MKLNYEKKKQGLIEEVFKTTAEDIILELTRSRLDLGKLLEGSGSCGDEKLKAIIVTATFIYVLDFDLVFPVNQ